MKGFFKTIVQVEILSEGPYVNELPVDKLLSSIEYDATYGHTSNYITVVRSDEITKDELEAECLKHGTDSTFFTGGT